MVCSFDDVAGRWMRAITQTCRRGAQPFSEIAWGASRLLELTVLEIAVLPLYLVPVLNSLSSIS